MGSLNQNLTFMLGDTLRKMIKAGGEGSIFLTCIISKHMGNIYIMVPVALKSLE